MRLRLAVSAVFLLFGIPIHAAEIKGKVTNVVGGEALGRIEVSVLELKVETTTAADGTFAIKNLPAGNYVLRVNAVGYRLLTVPFALVRVNDMREFSVARRIGRLSRSALAHSPRFFCSSRSSGARAFCSRSSRRPS